MAMASSLVSRRSVSRMSRGLGYDQRTSTASDPPRVSSLARAVLRLCRQMKWVIIPAAALLLWWLLYLVQFSNLGHGPSAAGPISGPDLAALAVPPGHDAPPSASRRLRLFMPADAPHINLCKTIMSAVALGYPVPTLLNWRREYNRPAWHFAGSHIAKLESLLGAIDALLDDGGSGDARHDDLAVLVDAYDVWFQLPPDVLVQRYHQINREADERNRNTWRNFTRAGEEEAVFPVPPPRQDIVVSAAKDCFPDGSSGSDPHYAHWPPSPMPPDMYGAGTDSVPFSLDPARKYRKVRPRCVNSGMIMGTMGALRQALRRCRDKVDRVAMDGRQLWSDQALLAEVIGDQEMWREWVRHLGASWDGRQALNDPPSLAPEVRPVALAALLHGRRFEFGIGLDYNFTTIPPTCSAEEDGAFVKPGDAAAVERASAKAGVPGPVRVHGIPPELNRSDEVPDDAAVAWGERPLYTDLFFGTTPVGIHHNAYVGGLKPWRLKHWWGKMWYHGQLRELVARRLRPGAMAPLAKIRSGEDIVTYWASREEEEQRKAVRVFGPLRAPGDQFTPIGWDEVCQKKGRAEKWYDELFGDGKGPLDV